ncbi:porin [Paraburkholderia sp. RP-4-7]|uniref:Porin n=1 Tax=Paraburkholderia polaris TaxID=2728848 RepID=A0A848J0B4_9BURK|nr:porin [Paraburkholderia polaris]NMM04587.1 porin [Paraburkholderia polaris]
MAAALLFAHGMAHADGVFQDLLPGFNPGTFPRGGSMFTIYGSVDEYFDHLNSGGQSVNRILSGGTWTSKLGFYGQEDLGGGTIAAFDLEAGFNANDGTFGQTGTLFNRQSTVSLSNPAWGTLSLGKQFGAELQMFVDPFLLNAKISPLAYFSVASDLGKGASYVEARVNNSAMYSSPTFAGFSTQLLYALKSDQSQGPATQNRGLNVTYHPLTGGQNLYLVGSYNQTWCDPGAGTCTDPTVRTDEYGAAMVYDMGRYVFSGSYQLIDPKEGGDYLASVYSLGAAATFGRNLVRASVVYRHTTQDGNHATGATLGEDYFLSKRTALYVRGSLIKNGPQSAMTIDYAAGSPVPKPGVTVTDLAVGIYHNF